MLTGRLNVFILILCCGIPIQHVSAQVEHRNNHLSLSLMNEIWEAAATLRFQVYRERPESNPTMKPEFSDKLMALDGKDVELSGYMIPITSSRKHEKFLLSVLPVLQCMYCGQNGIPPMIEIFMESESVQFTETPITVKGRLRLNEDYSKGAEIQLHAAELIGQ